MQFAVVLFSYFSRAFKFYFKHNFIPIMFYKFSLFLLILPLIKLVSSESEFCHVGEGSCGKSVLKNSYKQRRYLLYDVNPGEGFNLRRDVYMRIATLVKKLNKGSATSEWILVLPPWGPLYHWKTNGIGNQAQLKWSKFFDLSSLSTYVPVVEVDEFLAEYGFKIDVLYYLQHYAEGWTNNGWEEKADIRKCIEYSPYAKTKEGEYSGWFWGYDNIFAAEFHCLSIQGYSSTLKKFIETTKARAIMIDRAEVILHDAFGDAEYWMVRRSMSFAKDLIDIANTFRKQYLNSTDEKDITMREHTGLDSPIQRKAIGGPYVAVHMRRQDFVHARPKDVPNIPSAAQQILEVMKKLNLQLLFVATDALDTEFKELQQYIPGAIRFVPSTKQLKTILDGGAAIVDQWICAHARHFLGTFESTFSFRIQEEREILGFPVARTFNRLCGDNQTTCAQPSQWTIVF